MKKSLVLFSLSIFFSSLAQSQSFPFTLKGPKSKPIKQSSSLISAGISLPIGDFSETHFIGLGANYTWIRHYFTGLKKVSKNPGFTITGGFDHYFGKKESNGFRFYGLNYIKVMPGIIKQLGLSTHAGLSAGVACRIYKSNFDFAPAIILNGIFFVKESIGISPSVQYIKHTNENALWALGISGIYFF